MFELSDTARILLRRLSHIESVTSLNANQQDQDVILFAAELRSITITRSSSGWSCPSLRAETLLLSLRRSRLDSNQFCSFTRCITCFDNAVRAEIWDRPEHEVRAAARCLQFTLTRKTMRLISDST